MKAGIVRLPYWLRNLRCLSSKIGAPFNHQKTMRNPIAALAILLMSTLAYGADLAVPQPSISEAQADQLYSLTHDEGTTPEHMASDVKALVPPMDLKTELKRDYRAHLSSADADELIRFYTSALGVRYRRFIDELGKAFHKGSRAYYLNPFVTPPVAASVLQSRMALLDVSLQYAVNSAGVKAGVIAAPDPAATRTFDGAMDYVARVQGDVLDVIAANYKDDLPAFVAFQATPAAQGEFLAIGEQTTWIYRTIAEFVKAKTSSPRSRIDLISSQVPAREATPVLEASRSVSLPSPVRFVARGNQVFDVKTGLVWARCNFGQTWDETNNWCSGVARHMNIGDATHAVAGKVDGWRLPTLEELLSITDVTCESAGRQQASGQTLFGDVVSGPNDWYLTSTMNDAAHVMAFSCLGHRSGGLGLRYIGMVRLVKADS